MQLRHGLHLAYCTNIHRGETWDEIFANLQTHVLAVRDQVCPDHAYAIGLRLGNLAARDLAQREKLTQFRTWLEAHRCYVFTVNGFPYGAFHGTRVKERVYAPDWTQPERLDYTKQLFDLLAELLPDGVEGGVSTVPGSFKAFIRSDKQIQAIVENLWRCVDHLDHLRQQTGRMLHLDLEPEPLCLLETTEEVVNFFERLRNQCPGDSRLTNHLRVNYDACHLAVEFEDPQQALERLQQSRIRIGKFHLSSALKVRPSPQSLPALRAFADPVYLHQVVVRTLNNPLRRFRDLPEALECLAADSSPDEEWRIHYHIPLHALPSQLWSTTTDHLLGVLDYLAAHPETCQHLEMETYTWEVLPPELATRSVADQLAGEYAWTLRQLAERGLAQKPPSPPG
jgi:sugar phosphate isomerase/epimerase